MYRRACLVVSLVAVAILNSGCFLRFTLGVRIAQTLSEEIELIVNAIQTQATTAVCQTDPFFSPNFNRCTYFINGVEVASTVNLLTEGGPLGALIDPVIVELPTSATNIAGTFSGGGQAGNLLVYPNLSYVPIDDTRTLTPSAGKQLVIIDLPANVPVQGVTYDFQFSFTQKLPKGSPPTEVKGILAGRVRVGGKTYYPPILPCVSNIANAPLIRLASSSTPQALTVLGSFAGCNQQVYQYFRSGQACDLDNDADVDAGDIALIMAVRNRTASPGDPRDVDATGVINANDARYCTQRCTRAGCA